MISHHYNPASAERAAIFACGGSPYTAGSYQRHGRCFSGPVRIVEVRPAFDGHELHEIDQRALNEVLRSYAIADADEFERLAGMYRVMAASTGSDANRVEHTRMAANYERQAGEARKRAREMCPCEAEESREVA
jgi:hypothetical protein